jgi:predicted sulfurtransferase
VYHLCTQRLPNPYHEFPKNLRLFEEGNFVYDKVLSVRQELTQADWNPCRKIGKNHLEWRKQSDYLTSESCSFLHKSQNLTRSVSLESRQCRISIDTSFDQIRASKYPQPSVQKKVLKEPNTRQILSKSDKMHRASN